MSIIEKAADRLKWNTASAEPAVANHLRNGAFPSAPGRPFASHAPPASAKPVQDIDLAQLHRAGLVTPKAGRTMVAEEFRAIKRPLIGHADARGSKAVWHGNLIMVTSSLPGEGKTFCAINLAMSIAAEMDHTVLLVDTDVAHPCVLSTLGLKADAGLTDVVVDDGASLSDVIIKTNVEKLSVLHVGKTHGQITELLASQHMASLLDELAGRYPDRIVIFDSPPLLATSEARVLAPQMGQVVVVVEAGTTTQQTLSEAIRKIEACPNISLVYNKGNEFPKGGYDYYRRA